MIEEKFGPGKPIEMPDPQRFKFAQHIPQLLPGAEDDHDDSSVSADDIPPVQIDDDDPDDDSQDAVTTAGFEAVGGVRTTIADTLQSGMPRRPRHRPTTNIGKNLRREILSKANGECITFVSLTEEETADMLQAITRQAPTQEVIDARDSGAEIPKNLETWNTLSPIFIIPQGHNAFRNRVGSDLAKAVLSNGRGLIVFVKPAGIETDSDAKPTESEGELVFDLHPDDADIERAAHILIDLCAKEGTKAIRGPEAIKNNDDLNILISVAIVRRLYEETMEEKLRSAKGRRFINEAKSKIHGRQSMEIERKFQRPAKDEEIRIDMDEVKQIALGEMIKDEDGDKTISDELLARFAAIPEESRKTLVAELYEIFTHTEHLAKGIALLRDTNAHADKRDRLMHGWETLEYIENECLGHKQETGIEKSTIEKGESDVLSGNSPESEQYIRTIKYLVMRSFEQMQNEKGAGKMELCMPHGRMTLQNAMGHLTSNTPKGEILRRELSALSLYWARETLKEIEKLIDTDIADDFFDMYEIPGHPQKAPKNSTLVDQDILDSPLTPAICIIKIAMHALKMFNDFDSLEEEMYNWTGEMLEITAELTNDSIPPHLPVALARLRRKYAPQEREREAIIELDLYEHQTPLCA